jgi:hypothetical protein
MLEAPLITAAQYCCYILNCCTIHPLKTDEVVSPNADHGRRIAAVNQENKVNIFGDDLIPAAKQTGRVGLDYKICSH